VDWFRGAEEELVNRHRREESDAREDGGKLEGPATTARATARPEDWLLGGGEMGKLIRTMDWSRTPLGQIESWPQSLRTTVSLGLASNFPISLAWGPQHVQIYNDGYWPICGAKHPRAMGQDFSECWASAWPVIGEAFERALAGQTSYLENQRMFLDRNGYLEETFFTFSFSPIRDESGGVGGLFHPVTETTSQMLNERRTRALRDLAARAGKAQSVEESFRLAAETLSDCALDLPFVLFYLLDPEDDEARLAAWTGLAPGSLASPSVAALSPAHHTGWPLHEVARSKQIIEVGELAARFPGLASGPYAEAPKAAFAMPITPPGSERPAGIVLAAVSPRLPMNEAYRAFYDLFAAGVTSAVANACAYEAERRRAEALAEIDRAKSAFFSNVSHEFRTPLTLMLGPLEDALGGARPLSPELREQLTLAHRNAMRLLKLVNTLLDFSRLEAGRIEASYQDTDLPRATAELASLFRSAVEGAGLAFIVRCEALSAPACVDREMWEKIVLNLLSNALKFTFKGEIALTLREESGRAVLTVRDTGTGIPTGELPRVFERFHRVQGARARSHEGSGIGLALVHELVKLHGGEVAAESAFGEGSTFTVAIPLGMAHLPRERIGTARALPSTALGAAPFVEEAVRWLPHGDGSSRGRHGLTDALQPSGAIVAAGDIPPRLHARRVLLADDNADLRTYVTGLLEPHFTIEAVTNGEEALRAARERKPDVILTDVMMPVLDGFALLRAVRSDPMLRGIPVILLSARAGEESKVEGLEKGADDYLVKPFAARELVARVRAHLEMSEVREEIARHQATEQTLRASEEKLRLALAAADMGLWNWDLASGELQWSERCKQLFSLDPEVSMTYELFLAAIHLEDRERIDRAVKEALANKTDYDVAMRVPWPDGTVHWVASMGRGFHDEEGRAVRMTGVSRDITERKLGEEALRESDRRKSEFLAMLSHELRNPLAPIRNSLYILERAAPGGEQASRAKAVIDRQVMHLTRLVDDLLDVTRISRGVIQLQRERVELNILVARAAEDHRSVFDKAGVDLDVEVLEQQLYVYGDPVRLNQVVGNLLSNAAKFTPRGGSARISVLLEGPRSAAVVVRDTGAGMEPEMLAHLFEPFVQADKSLDRSKGGLGLGLVLVKGVAQLHGGKVSVSSEGTGRGAAFTVHLPLLSAVAPRLADAGDREPQAHVQRVLIIEDNVDSAASLKDALELSDHVVAVAHTGREGLEKAREFRPDVILCDIGLPEMDGYEVARRLRSDSELRAVPLVALSGYAQPEDVQRARDAGFKDHLAKPPSIEVLEEKLARIAGGGGRRTAGHPVK